MEDKILRLEKQIGELLKKFATLEKTTKDSLHNNSVAASTRHADNLTRLENELNKLWNLVPENYSTTTDFDLLKENTEKTTRAAVLGVQDVNGKFNDITAKVNHFTSAIESKIGKLEKTIPSEVIETKHLYNLKNEVEASINELKNQLLDSLQGQSQVIIGLEKHIEDLHTKVNNISNEVASVKQQSKEALDKATLTNRSSFSKNDGNKLNARIKSIHSSTLKTLTEFADTIPTDYVNETRFNALVNTLNARDNE